MEVLRLELVTNPDETRTTLRFKKNELNAAIKKKNLLKRNRQNKKLFRDWQKEKNITGNYMYSRIMLEYWIIWGGEMNGWGGVGV